MSAVGPAAEKAQWKTSPSKTLFYLDGPDEDGCVWICSADLPGQWCHNLGPVAKVAEVLSQWLATIDDAGSDFRDTQDK